MDDKQIKELEQSLRINDIDLDNEVMHQAELYYHVASAYAQAQSEMARAWDDVKSTDANLDKAIREHYRESGEKTTEARIAADVQVAPERISAYEHYLNKKLQADRLQALKEAFSQRSYMLRDLIQLQLSSMHMDTSATGGRAAASELQYEKNKELISKSRETSNKAMQSRLKRRRKETA